MILIVGATGQLGGQITRLLLDSGKQVRILVRENSPSEEMAKQGLATSAQSLIQIGAQPVYGDLKDRASLDAACQGIDTVITTATAALRGGEDTVEAVDLRGTLDLMAAAKKARVRHFIYIGANSRDINIPGLPHAKAFCEKAIQESGLEYTILLPTGFLEVWLGLVIGAPLQARQPVTLVGKGDHKHNWVSQRDVAAFAVACIENLKVKNREIIIGGPASYSWTEIVETTGKYLGFPLPIQYVTPGSPIPLLPPVPQELITGGEMFEDYVDMNQTAQEFGIRLTSLEDSIQRMFSAPSA